MVGTPVSDQARDHLYRGQCNCAYWHGAFGGVYLPHLRNAVYRHLITADNLLDRANGKPDSLIETIAEDFDFDLRREIRLANNELICWIKPSGGGHLYELDVRDIGHNLLATMQRRPESYHELVKQAAPDQAAANDGQENESSTASIHDRVKFKQDDLDQKLIYDRAPRKSLVDHFWPADVTLDSIAANAADELGDFVEGPFQSTVRRSSERHQVLLSRIAKAGDARIKLTKGITLSPASKELKSLICWRTYRMSIPFISGLNSTSPDCQPEMMTGCFGITLAIHWVNLASGWIWKIANNWNWLTNGWIYRFAFLGTAPAGYGRFQLKPSVNPKAGSNSFISQWSCNRIGMLKETSTVAGPSRCVLA